MDEQTRKLVEEAEARASKATPGPWTCRPSVTIHEEDCDDVISKGDGNRTIAGGIERAEAIGFDDSDFIAHARTDVPALCAKVRELSVALDERTIAAEAWDALAIARLIALNKANERIQELEKDVGSCDEYEANALRQIGEEVVQGRACERGELAYWINQIHEHYRKRVRTLEGDVLRLEKQAELRDRGR